MGDGDVADTDLDRSISPTVDGFKLKEKVETDLNILVDPKSTKTYTAEEVRLMLVPQLMAKIKLEVKYGKVRDSRRDLRNKLESLEKKVESLEKKVLLSEWPIKIRSIIFDVEGDLNLTSLSLCFQCGIVHAPLCTMVKSTRKYPSEAKAQRLFLRRQRWIHVLTTCTYNPRVGRIVMALQEKFSSIHSQTIKDEMTDAEKFISNLEDFDTLIFWFSQSVADIFEELSTSSKIAGSTCEVENLCIFSAPYNLFATILVNSSIIFNECGEVKLKSKRQLNSMAKEFIPKKDT